MKRKVKRHVLITSIFVVAIGGAFGLSKMKPPPETKNTADVDLLVEVLLLEQTVANFTVRSQGTIRPRTETILGAEVSGTIVSISPKFIAGGVFARGEELLRIVRPRGSVIIAGKLHPKAVPEGVGEWTHPYHGADNNPQSWDRLARAPYLTRFLASPWYGPMPEVTVSAGGRLFKAFGFLAFKRREWPLVGKLIAMDGYHGTTLWERDLQPGFMIHRNTLIATEDTLYVADNASCKLLDPSTGKVEGEIVVAEGEADGPSCARWRSIPVSFGALR